MASSVQPTTKLRQNKSLWSYYTVVQFKNGYGVNILNENCFYIKVTAGGGDGAMVAEERL